MKVDWKSLRECYDEKFGDFSSYWTYYEFLSGDYYQELLQKLKDSTTKNVMTKCAEDYEKAIMYELDLVSSKLSACTNTCSKESMDQLYSNAEIGDIDETDDLEDLGYIDSSGIVHAES